METEEQQTATIGKIKEGGGIEVFPSFQLLRNPWRTHNVVVQNL